MHTNFSHYTLPEIITVYIDENGGQCKEVVVEIENKSIVKPFLGGYKFESIGMSLIFIH